MQVTGTRQREAWRRKELPPVEQVTGGVWSVPVPMPRNPLRYVISYLLEHDAGFVMIDPGWNAPESLQALTEGLAQCQIPADSVSAILITHVHPDHHGLSGAMQRLSGAWIGMHEKEDAFLAMHRERDVMRDGMSMYLRWCGAPRSHLEALTASREAAGAREPMLRADRTIGNGELIDVPGLRLRAVWTPGHTPGHLCFHDETHDLLLTGDHVLPRITPNISAYDLSSQPLADYLASLRKLHGIQPLEVLPAHEYRFSDLDARLDALDVHHRERLAEAEQVLKAASAGQSAWQVAGQVSWSRSWQDLASFQRQAAVGEVIAHLRYIQARGHADCADVDGVGLWRWLGSGENDAL
jgi:glyoxylase-like metal-dependent hydrolase (beta-lactamase superfamily II)